MNELLPFSEFYRLALDEALDRAGRPDGAFFEKLASYPGINAKYYAKLARKDWLERAEGARDLEPCAFYHPKIKSHFLRYYGPTAFNLHYMEVHARASRGLRNEPELIDRAEQRIADVIAESTKEIDRYGNAAEHILKENGVTEGVRYGTGPLLVPAEVISPYCGMYLELIMRADRLMGLLEYQRLRRYIRNIACDREFTRVDRLLKAVSRSAFELAKGLRQRANAVPEGEEPGGRLTAGRSSASKERAGHQESDVGATADIGPPGQEQVEKAEAVAMLSEEGRLNHAAIVQQAIQAD